MSFSCPIVGLLAALVAIDAASHLMLSLVRPEFKFVAGNARNHVLFVVFDGLMGDPELRFKNMQHVFGGNSVLYVRQQGERYDFEQTAVATLNELYGLKNHNNLISLYVIPVGMSLGAKPAYRLIELIRERPSLGMSVIEFKLIDPLFDSSGIISRNVKFLAKLYPGAIGNYIARWLIMPFFAKGNSDLRRQRRFMPLSRVAAEARAALEFTERTYINRMQATIIHCHPDDEGVLRPNQVHLWQSFLSQNHVRVQPLIQAERGSRHVGLDVDGEKWEAALTSGLKSALAS